MALGHAGSYEARADNSESQRERQSRMDCTQPHAGGVISLFLRQEYLWISLRLLILLILVHNSPRNATQSFSHRLRLYLTAITVSANIVIVSPASYEGILPLCNSQNDILMSKWARLLSWKVFTAFSINAINSYNYNNIPWTNKSCCTIFARWY